MKYRIALLAAAGTLALGTAYAQEDKGYYGAVGLGYAWEYGLNDFDSDNKDTTTFTDITSFDSSVDTSGGIATYYALGKYMNRGLRGEVELSWRLQDVDALPGEQAPNSDVQGDGAFFAGFPGGGDQIGSAKVGAIMVNVLKDFAVTEKLTPYVGAGIGLARVRYEMGNLDDVPVLVTSTNQAQSGYRISMADPAYVPAFQGRAGVRSQISENLSAELGYRYLQTGRYDMEAYVNNTTPVTTDVTGDYSVHETTFGLRYSFGNFAMPWKKGSKPAEVATAAPAQPEVQTKTCFDGTVVPMGEACPEVAEDALTPAELNTVVYFEINSAELGAPAEALLRRRANEASEVELIEVVVSGGTDTTGTAGYNQRLSERRAAVVREALVRFGIDADKIRVVALGESSLARPTADGVDEPLNRRTEVEFDF